MPDMSFCAQQVRCQDNDRFLCALFAPAERREALFALYAFNLELASISDKVSEPLLGRMRLQWWREVVDGGLDDNAAGHPVAGSLARAVVGSSLTASSLRRLIDDRERDLDERPIPDHAAFLSYTADTAGALAEMSLDVLDVDDPVACEAARHVGLAWAGVGILRSIPFHAARRRFYLPADAMKEAGSTAEEVFAGTPSPGIRQVVSEVADWSRHHLDVARKSRGNIPAAALPALLPAVLAEIHLDRLRRAGFNPFDHGLARPAPWRVARLWMHARRCRF